MFCMLLPPRRFLYRIHLWDVNLYFVMLAVTLRWFKKKNKWHPNNGINLGHFRVTSLLLKQLLATWGSRYVSLDYFRPPFISCVSPGHNISVWWVDMRTDFWSSPLSIGFWTRFLIDSWHREICQTRWCNGWPRPSFGQILASAIAAMIKNITSRHPKIFTGEM